MTHIGQLIGCDARTPDGAKRTVKLRETKTMWVDEQGIKYRKATGYQTGERWPMWRLDLSTISLIVQ